MDGKKVLAKYIKPSSVISTIALILAVAMVGLIVAGIIVNQDDPNEAVWFTGIDNEVGEYVYLDVVGVSDWLVDYGDGDEVYYAAEDAQGYLYLVQLNKSQFNKMKTQQQFWNGETTTQEPYRLYGVAKKPKTDLLNTLYEVVEMTASEYEEYFGTQFINATTTPAKQDQAIWFVGAMFCGITALCLGAVTMSPNGAFKKCIKRLEENGQLERAAEQLESLERVTIGADMGRMSPNYLYGKNTGVVLAYEDIGWAYKKTIKRYFITVNAALIVCTVDGKEYSAVNYGRNDKFGDIENALMNIHEKNPRALIGFTKENQKAYKEMKKAAKL